MQLEIYPMWRIVAVDDTPVGIQAGKMQDVDRRLTNEERR